MIGIRYIGTNGSIWDLNNGPVRLTDKGIKGLWNPQIQFFTRKGAVSDGQETTGWRAEARPVAVPYLLEADDPYAWEALETIWWRAHAIGGIGYFEVTAPSGAVRTLPVRFEDDGNYTPGMDPSDDGMTEFFVNYVADKPWWLGPLQRSEFGVADGANFFGGPAGTGFGPPFYISPANTLATPTVNNAGDVAAWPLYIIEGPAVSFSATVKGGSVTAPFEVLAGDTLYIDTDERQKKAYVIDSTGARRSVTRDLSAVDWRRIDPGEATPIAISFTGSGRVAVEVVPKYKKAIG